MDSARLVGTTAIGLGAGYMLAVPFHCSAFRTLVDLSPRQKLHFWRASYLSGAWVMPRLLILSSIAFGLTAALSPAPSGLHPLLTNADLICAGASIVVIPYTLFGMRRPISILLAACKDEGTTLDVDAAVDDWLKLHFYRTLLVYSAFVLSITRLLHF